MSRCVGKKGAKEWGDAHEITSTAADETEMDQHNNGVGRGLFDDWELEYRIKKDGLGFCREPIWFDDPQYDGRCAKQCKQAEKDGKLKTLPDKGRWR